MASPSVIAAVQNGPLPAERFVDSIDPEDPERAKELMKPADVREDMKQMEARARVSQILNSQAFRDQLDEIIETQTVPAGTLGSLKSGPHLGSWVVPQQLLQLILPAASPSTASLQSTLMAGRGPVTPVADVRGVNSTLYTKGERALRCKVASVYRLIDLFGWVHGMHSSVTARASNEHILVNPLGLMYGEMTAGSLVKVDSAGAVVDAGNTCMGSCTGNLSLQLALHAARPDIGCIIHLLTSSALAVSLAKCGLLPISQEAMILGDIAYLGSEAAVTGTVDPDLLDSPCKVIFVRNRGMLVCGSTVEAALFMCYTAMAACDIQVRVMPLGLGDIIMPSDSARKQAAVVGRQGSQGVDTQQYNASSGRQWGFGELEFEAWMRLLDSAGYRTGYVYKQTMLRNEKPDGVRTEEESAAATLALKYYESADAKHSSARKEALGKQRRQQKVHWLSTGQGKTNASGETGGSPRHDSQGQPMVDGDVVMEEECKEETNSAVNESSRPPGDADNEAKSAHSTPSHGTQQPIPKARSLVARPKSEDPSRAYDRALSEGLLRTASDGLQPHSPSYLTAPRSPSSNGNNKSGEGLEPAVGKPTAAAAAAAEPNDKKKKKSKFRIPSFSKSKQDKKDKSKGTTAIA